MDGPDLMDRLLTGRGYDLPEEAGMIVFAVSEEKNRWLRERMEALGIREEDIEERFVRSSGKGGQHVNKASTCVWLRHEPTGIEVKCMEERSQSVNRFLARRELAERVEALSGKATARDRERERIRRQKAKRKRKARARQGAEGSGNTDNGQLP